MQQFNFSTNKQLLCAYTEKKDGNLSFNRGERRVVLKNRRKVIDKLKIRSTQLYEAEQVHGSKIVVIDKKNKGKRFYPKTDGFITGLPEVYLMIKVGDCLPVAFYDSKKKVIGICHVGWRGAIEKIFLENLFLMRSRFGCQAKDIKVAVGPGIRKCCFVHNRLIQEKLPEWDDYVKEVKGGVYADLAGFIKDKLVLHGIRRNNIKDSHRCTVCDSDLFSHFLSLRKNEPEGRLAMIIGLRN